MTGAQTAQGQSKSSSLGGSAKGLGSLAGGGLARGGRINDVEETMRKLHKTHDEDDAGFDSGGRVPMQGGGGLGKGGGGGGSTGQDIQ